MNDYINAPTGNHILLQLNSFSQQKVVMQYHVLLLIHTLTHQMGVRNAHVSYEVKNVTNKRTRWFYEYETDEFFTNLSLLSSSAFAVLNIFIRSKKHWQYHFTVWLFDSAKIHLRPEDFRYYLIFGIKLKLQCGLYLQSERTEGQDPKTYSDGRVRWGDL